MIELAPHHKYGLPIANPVMLAAGTVGYGEALPPGLQTAQLGAVVVGPFLRHSRAGHAPPRLAETNGGFVLDTGLQNRGVNAATKRFAPRWSELGCPVIAQIGDTQQRMAAAVAARLASEPGLLGVEVLVPRYATPQDAAELVRAVVRACDLPVLAKLPQAAAVQLAPAVVDAGRRRAALGRGRRYAHRRDGHWRTVRAAGFRAHADESGSTRNVGLGLPTGGVRRHSHSGPGASGIGRGRGRAAIGQCGLGGAGNSGAVGGATGRPVRRRRALAAGPAAAR